MKKGRPDGAPDNASEALEELDALWIKLRGVEAVAEGKWSIGLDYLRSHLILVVVSGHVQVTVDGTHFSPAPGSAIVCLPGQLVKAAAEGKDRSALYVLRFDARSDEADAYSSGRTEQRDCVFPASGSVPLSDSSWTAMNCESAAALWHSGDRLQKLQAQALFLGIVHRILLDFSRLQSDSDREPDTDMERALNQTKRYMDRHYDRTFTIDELAEMAGLSRYYYMRSFKRAFGISAMDYLLERRIEHAKRLMEKTDIRLHDIARQVGYSDEYYFGRKFKQKVGIPPAAYMKSRKRKVTAYSFPNIGQLLALRIVPYAAPMDHSWTDLYRRKYDSDVVVKLSHDYGFNLEALRQAGPDFIIGIDHFVPEEEQGKLKGIAPAFFVPWSSADWRGHLQLTADFLGNEAEAAAWLEEYDRKAGRAADQIKETIRAETVAVLQLHKGKLYAYGSRSVAGVLYQDLGLSPPAGIGIAASHEEITPQRLSELDADRIFLMITDSVNPRARWDELRRTREWSSLKAARNERITLISPYLWFEYSAYTQEKFLHDVSGFLKA